MFKYNENGILIVYFNCNAAFDLHRTFGYLLPYILNHEYHVMIMHLQITCIAITKDSRYMRSCVVSSLALSGAC